MVTIQFTITEAEADALAQFLKRSGHSDYRSCAVDDGEAYQMQYAGQAIRQALAEAGFDPR